jgi:hypothetical protein
VENIFIKDLPWEKSTDRDIDFKRRYPRRYYDYAIQWIQCEMSRYKNNQDFSGLLLILRSFKARGGMLWEKLKQETHLTI